MVKKTPILESKNELTDFGKTRKITDIKQC